MVGSHQLINFTDDRSGLADIGKPEGGEDSKSGQRLRNFQRLRPRHPWDFFMWPQYSSYLSPLQIMVAVQSDARTLQIVVLWFTTPCILVRVHHVLILCPGEAVGLSDPPY